VRGCGEPPSRRPLESDAPGWETLQILRLKRTITLWRDGSLAVMKCVLVLTPFRCTLLIVSGPP
jgi:hypothetical protein